MVRAYFRHAVTDVAGNALQNAKCFLYQPGTTTAVTDAYDAASGGSLVTFLISNDQGEIACWFASPQAVDVKVTDNSDGAYYPASPSAARAWTDFTETVSVLPAPSEVAWVRSEKRNVLNYPTVSAAFADTPTNGTLHFPQSGNNTYTADAAITRTTGIKVVGDAGVTLAGLNAGTNILNLAMAASDQRIQIEGLNLSGGLNSVVIDAPLYINGQSYVRDLNISSPAQRGFHVLCGLASIEIVNNVNIENPGIYGFHAEGDFFNAVVLNKLRVASSDTAAVYINNLGASARDVSVTLLNPIIESNLGAGLRFNQTQALVLSPYFEQNGQTAGAADIQMDSDGASSPVTEVAVVGGYFATPHANQASVRIRATDDFCRLTLIAVNAAGTPIYDGGGFTSGMRTTLVGCLPGWTIQNNGGAASDLGSGTLTVSGVITAGSFVGSATPDAIAAPTLLNSWVNNGGGSPNAGYYKHDGRVWLSGAIKDGSDNTVAFTLPAGYRPAANMRIGGATFNDGAADLPGFVYVETNGQVTIDGIGAAGAVDFVSLEGVSFRV